MATIFSLGGSEDGLSLLPSSRKGADLSRSAARYKAGQLSASELKGVLSDAFGSQVQCAVTRGSEKYDEYTLSFSRWYTPPVEKKKTYRLHVYLHNTLTLPLKKKNEAQKGRASTFELIPSLSMIPRHPEHRCFMKIQVECILPGVMATLPARKRRELARLWHVDRDKPHQRRTSRQRASASAERVKEEGTGSIPGTVNFESAIATKDAEVATRGSRSNRGLIQPDRATATRSGRKGAKEEVRTASVI